MISNLTPESIIGKEISHAGWTWVIDGIEGTQIKMHVKGEDHFAPTTEEWERVKADILSGAAIILN